MTSIEELKEKIRKKFGSMARFTEATGITLYELQCSESLSEIDKVVDKLRVKGYVGQIPAKKLSTLKIKIKAIGGVAIFCDKNPQFNSRSLFQILQGRRKRMSPIVKELFEHFDI